MNIALKLVRITNDVVSRVAGDHLGICHVNEYPKCGGTWVSRLVRSYLGIERSYGVEKLVRPHSVILKHELRAHHLSKPIIVVRDPRDVWVSFYFYEIYNHEGTSRAVELRGLDRSADDSQNLHQYIVEKTEEPHRFSPGYSYAEFCDSWIDRAGICLVRYEDVHSNPERELKRMLEFLDERDIDEERIRRSIDENSFQNITGRSMGTADKYSHKRKGIVGDWRNLFSQETCAYVHALQQPLLERLGYESDGSWVDRESTE